MDHTHIVSASDLDRYADTIESQGVIPELVYLLVRQSCGDLTSCRIPYGDSINQPGLDGLIETSLGFREFVPSGISFWEIGTGNDPQKKATLEFKKRTKEILDDQRTGSTFVFATPRSAGSGGWTESAQRKWLRQRNDKGWKEVRIIDGVILADWLREFPAIGKWMARKLNLTSRLGGLSTPKEHWDDMKSECLPDDPSLPSKLFTICREGACTSLHALFEGKSQLLMLFAESGQEVEDFVSAFISGLEPELSQNYSNRCLFINDEQAWRSVVETRSPHVLVADPRLGLDTDDGAVLQANARRKGHSIVIPLCGAWSGSNPEIIKLRSPSPHQIETVLKECGYTDVRAKELGRIGGDRISALRRHLRGLGTLPSYATWSNASLIAKAALIGQWEGSNISDRSAIENLLGKDYGEWIEILRPDSIRSDSPLIQRDEKWRVLSRGEVWDVLGSFISDSDLDRFKQAAILVLGEHDPKFDLPKEERFMAGLHHKVLKHSNLIRKGIAETLALLGSRSAALSSCTHGKAETITILVVRELLDKADWDRWASLEPILPLLAEAAPDEFLDAVESALINFESTPFRMIFDEEGSGFGGWNYLSGLLWALETLAWSPDYLSRVSLILADLASIDPGGNWSNRPSNSLVDIFLPWHVQTSATFEQRKTAIEAILQEHPLVGWKLISSLLPHSHGSTGGCHRPVWRNYIPRDWKDGVSMFEYWKQITSYTGIAISLAANDVTKLIELIDRLADLPTEAQEEILLHLESAGISSLGDVDRLPLWEKMNQFVRHHRRFSDARWALSKNVIDRIENTAKYLEPTQLELKYRHLFNEFDSDFYDEQGNYEEQQRRLIAKREAAVKTIVLAKGVSTIMEFAQTVAASYDVGEALSAAITDEQESEMLPKYLASTSEKLDRIIAGFIRAHYTKYGLKWVDSLLQRGWAKQLQARFLTYLPFEKDVWNRVYEHLGAENESYYWKIVKVNPYGSEQDYKVAIEKLLEYEREGSAVMIASRNVNESLQIDDEAAIRALLALIENGREFNLLDNYKTVELIKKLQMSETTDKEALLKIEWNLLALLDRLSSGAPITLEKRLASDPIFFSDLIKIVYISTYDDKVSITESDEKKHTVRNGYHLLTEWKRCPGTLDDGSFNPELFSEWIKQARKLTIESGHDKVGQILIGMVLTCAPADPEGLWIHKAVAHVLNSRDVGEMRSGFTTQLFNNRGVFTFTAGQDELRIAQENKIKAEALNKHGFTRFATAIREFAKRYERMAEQEAAREPFDD